jgi:hypothetical protein
LRTPISATAVGSFAAVAQAIQRASSGLSIALSIPPSIALSIPPSIALSAPLSIALSVPLSVPLSLSRLEKSE